MKKLDIVKAIKEVLKEEKPGLWANIRAKKARGEKPAHKNSNAHKDAVKAGKKINKEGLWANINAKKKAGKKPSHGNSNAHKDAEAAGNAMKKEGSEQDLKRGDQVTFKADPKAIWKILGIHGNTYRVNQQGERTMSYQPKPWLHNMIATGKATVI